MSAFANLLATASPSADVWGAPEPKSYFELGLESFWNFVTTTSASEWVFLVFASLAVFSALATITRRNVVTAAVWLVGSFFSVAVCYVLATATFLAAIQVLVYAGAMMVLFVFVIMVLDVDDRGAVEHRKPSRIGRFGYYGLAGLGTLFLMWIMFGTMARQYDTPGAVLTDPEFGTANAVGRELFGNYLFAFEAISLLLFAAVVGAVVVARSRRERVKEAHALGLSPDELHVAGLGALDDPNASDTGGDLTDAEHRRPHPKMNFGAPSAGGHEGGN